MLSYDNLVFKCLLQPMLFHMPSLRETQPNRMAKAVSSKILDVNMAGEFKFCVCQDET